MTRNQRKHRPDRSRGKRGRVPKPYRSWYEHDVAKSLTTYGLVVEDTGQPEYESLRLLYTVPSRKATYTPDFTVRHSDGTIAFVVESKGNFTEADRKKMALIRTQYPVLDVRILFQSDNKLSKSSHTRYSDWCEKRGIKCAVSRSGAIPLEWVEEVR